MKKSHSTDPSTSPLIQSTPNTTKRIATIRSFGRSISSMRSWSQKSRSTPMAIRSSLRRCRSWKMPKSSGVLYGPKRVRRRLEELRIWSIRFSSVPLNAAPEITALMSRLICTWNWSTILVLRRKGKIWLRKFVLLRKREQGLRSLWTFHRGILKSLGKILGRRIHFDLYRLLPP